MAVDRSGQGETPGDIAGKPELAVIRLVADQNDIGVTQPFGFGEPMPHQRAPVTDSAIAGPHGNRAEQQRRFGEPGANFPESQRAAHAAGAVADNSAQLGDGRPALTQPVDGFVLTLRAECLIKQQLDFRRVGDSFRFNCHKPHLALRTPRAYHRLAVLRLIAPLTACLILLPLLAGLGGTALPAFGILPGIGIIPPSDPWVALLRFPGLGTSLGMTLWTGLTASALSVVLAISLIAALYGTRFYRRLQVLLAPVLAMPHAALAIGVLLLLTPSGWLSRLLSPWLTSWDRPPDIGIIGDPYGISLILLLAAKETAFILFVALGLLYRMPTERLIAAGRNLGHRRHAAFLRCVLPQLYPRLFLPICAVLSYSLANVDMALIVGPQTPPTLAVRLLSWFSDPDLTRRYQAAAGALLLAASIFAAIGLWRVAIAVISQATRRWLTAGPGPETGVRLALGGMTISGAALFGLALGGLPATALWSIAGPWRFPDALPTAFDPGAFTDPAILATASVTLGIATAAALICCTLILLCLEAERRRGSPARLLPVWLLYLPLVIPQLSFLFGVQILLLRAGLDPGFLAVLALHCLFVLPYGWLVLAPAWRAVPSRLDHAAHSLGAGPWRVFLRLRLPLLFGPLAVCIAVGLAVSIAQYLPTLFAGAGRVATLTTEAVTLAAGANRRAAATHALLQTTLPWLAFAAAGAALSWQRRRF